jgi:arylsulfatase A-like enzyme
MLSLMLAVVALTADPVPRPNFVFFLTDDQRADALSLANHAILKTPNIDRIGREGAWFRNAFVVNSLCTPSRASFLTGRYGHATGVLDNSGNRTLPASERTVAEILRDQGYEVAFVGKSHIAGSLRDRPWDYYFGFKEQGRYIDPIIAEGKEPDRVYPGYMDDVLTDHALSYLAKPRTKPFCLFVWFKAPHRSWVRAPRFAQLYEGETVPEPPNFRAGLADKPKAVQQTDMQIGSANHRDVPSLDKLVKDYSATVAAVDDNVGRVLDQLDRQKLADDTVVIYGSDNGFFLGEWNLFDKRLMYEPSIRIPLLIRYPRKVKPGTLRTEMALNIDLAPTMLELAGIPVPSSMHGRSLAPLLSGESIPWRDAWLYEYYEYPQPHHVRPHRGIRTERWKLIRYEGQPEEWELYDLANDPHESHNLYGEVDQAENVEKLKRRLEELRRETGDPELTRSQ